MAKIEYGGGITALSGSIRGWSFQTNHSGNIVKGRSRILKTQSTKKTERQAILSYLIAEWYNLTIVNKNLWNAFAVIHQKENMWGQLKTLTGFNWFVCINSNRLQTNQNILPAPPIYVLPSSTIIYYLSISNTFLKLMYNCGAANANTGMFVFTTAKIKSLSGPTRKFLRFTTYKEPLLPASIDITSDWENTHGISIGNPSDYANYNIQAFLVLIEKTSGIDTAGTFLTKNFILPAS